MSKRAAIAKAARATPSEDELLHCVAVTQLSDRLSQAISSASERGKARPSRSGCARLALQMLLVALALRRAALVDSLGLTLAQASAISSKLPSIIEHMQELEDLRQIRVLHHAPTSQTFIVSTRNELWADAALPQQRLWIDARISSDHASPTLSGPDPHIVSLAEAVREAITEATDPGLLVISTLLDVQAEAQLAGVALAGFLLEYAAIYCLHDSSPMPTAKRYRVGPLIPSEEPIDDECSVTPSANCLGCHPLLLCKVLWMGPRSNSMELLSFSIPQDLITDQAMEHLRKSLIATFQSRLDLITPSSSSSLTALLASGHISVQVHAVALDQVML